MIYYRLRYRYIDGNTNNWVELLSGEIILFLEKYQASTFEILIIEKPPLEDFPIILHETH